MTIPSTAAQRDLIVDLRRRIESRNARAAEIERAFSETQRDIDERRTHKREALREKHQLEYDALQGEYLDTLEEIRERSQKREQAIVAQRDAALAGIENQFRRRFSEGELHYTQTRAIALQQFATDTEQTKESQQRSHVAFESCQQQFDWLEGKVEAFLQRRGRKVSDLELPPSDPEISTGQLLQRYASRVQELNQEWRQLSGSPGIRFVDEGWPAILFVVLVVLFAVPLGMRAEWNGWQWGLIAGIAAAVGAIATRQVVERIARGRQGERISRLERLLFDSRIALSHANEMLHIEQRRRGRELEKRKNQRLRQADEAWQTIARDLEEEKTKQVEATQQEASRELEATRRGWDEEASACRARLVPRIEACQNERNRVLDKWDAECDALARAADATRNQAWTELLTDWRQAASQFANQADAMRQFQREHFPDYRAWLDASPDANGSDMGKADLAALCFGAYEVPLAELEGDVPRHPRFSLDWEAQTLPAALAFPSAPSLLIEAELEGRSAAISVLQNCMLRLLVSFPPGKVRFTIFDPTGLGENFSTFMHLSDYDERLVTNRIWTESSHIQLRLADLTEHMENVIQKYLRNEFPSIQAYNERAGEIAEPFQVLVIANFPANFSEEAARRLVSIANSGARCGVFLLMSVDGKMKMPQHFDIRDLEMSANTLVWRDGRLVWKHPELEPFALELESPPDASLAREIVRRVGQAAKDANRVEVPFATVAPASGDWWTRDSRQLVEVPLGRSGATQLQSLTLGMGTSQHVLIAGKTGSGKSTLLNAIITNLALYYAPSELQFYLVDFKKGVEFKAYAQHQLPHARVIAIESEREFGMSVLERLDQELQTRGELFRSCSAQNVAAFREARPDIPMPRLLLIVDEFQEFFVKDDKISQDAALLLDRLVRQGRAFGIHVLLGSQTLAGAYSLARSTLGQMAVRIALQCSEADAHLILSEENTAARLLNRPGEAIYNNANGLFEGNHPFQVVWLSDSEREAYLRDLNAFASRHAPNMAKAIVFEGNSAADLAENPAWHELIQTRHRSTTAIPGDGAEVARPIAWLGAPVAIKEPTRVEFRRHSGSNLLVVGTQEELAMGVLASGLLGLLASAGNGVASSPGLDGARILVLDGGSVDVSGPALGPRVRRWQLPGVEVFGRDEVAVVLDRAGREMESRQADVARAEREPPWFVIVHNLSRLRELRKSDDDFGLGSFGGDESASPGRQFIELLRNGPPLGLHCLLWCDTYNNLTRCLDRQTLRDLGHRVLFQMNATDSSHLMDSSAATHLGPYRAILYDDERGEFEKFRPYGFPDDRLVEWLATHATRA